MDFLIVLLIILYSVEKFYFRNDITIRQKLNTKVSLGSVGAQLIVSVLRNVAHPRQCLVAALFDDLQVSHLLKFTTIK